MSWAIRCRNLRKTYAGKPPVEAVRGIDLEIAEGECFGVLGPNGAGKTTTIEMFEGLIEPTGGEIEVFGVRWRDDPQSIRRRIGISLQETKFSDKLTVLETVRLFRSFYPSGPTPEAAIARVGLEEKSRTWIKNLSGGQRQRLAVAVALVGEPQLLFLDEPTTGLDPHSRRQVWEVVASGKRQGRTTVLTTHYMEEAEQLCDRIALVDRGRVIALGTPPQLIAQLGGRHVVEFALNPAEAMDDPSEPWRDLSGVIARRRERDAIHLTVAEPHVVLPLLLDQLARRGWTLARLVTRPAKLDDVFVAITGRTLTENGSANGAERAAEGG